MPTPKVTCLCTGEAVDAYCPVHGTHVTFDKPIVGSDGAVQTGWQNSVISVEDGVPKFTPCTVNQARAASSGALSAADVHAACIGQGYTMGRGRIEEITAALNATLAAHDQSQFDKGWQLAHELAKCGHPRACYQDPNWPKSEGNEKCIVCEQIAAHDQKVREAERKKVAHWMMENSFATGHGDTVEDLLAELTWQVKEERDKQKVREPLREAVDSCDLPRAWRAKSPCQGPEEICCHRRCADELTDWIRRILASPAEEKP